MFDEQQYQDTLSYASSKVDHSVGENLFMLPSNMTLKIKTGTVGYNNKILISNGKFILGKNDEVNSSETPAMKRHKTDSLETPAIKNHKTNSLETPTIKNHKTNSLETPAIESHSNTVQGLRHAPTISHEDEKTALILFITLWLYCLVSFSMKVPCLTSGFLQYGIFSNDSSLRFCKPQVTKSHMT